jgi:hypothetical protein
MGATDFFKAAVDSLDKVTDILNVGRLIFYTAAGFCGLLPAAMTVRLLGKFDSAADTWYWSQFFKDLDACAKSGPVWLAALIFGFVIANVAASIVMNQFPSAPPHEISKESYAYSYPRLFSGGIPKQGAAASKDYAAWLISEYYRYLEIAVYIPFGILISLPVYSLYSLTYLILKSSQTSAFVINGAHVAFALWTLASVVVWTTVWPDFWVPRIAVPLYHDWVNARRAAIHGLQDFINDAPPPGKADTQSVPAKQ